jgi:hypothetical protein
MMVKQQFCKTLLPFLASWTAIKTLTPCISFETENRITQQEIGEVRNAGTDQEFNVIQGSYSYTGPDGVTYTVNYIADENGFRASGDHIPTAAPVPAEIAEAVQQNAAEEAQGYVDDGQYRSDGQEAPRGRPQKGYNNY